MSVHSCKIMQTGIYAEGYIVFAFPFICSFLHASVMFMEFMTVFHRAAGKFLKLGISHEPLIRKHSYLDQ